MENKLVDTPETKEETVLNETVYESDIYPTGKLLPEEKKNKQMTLKELIDFVRDVAVILAIVLLIRTYIVSPFQINGSSMETSYHTNEYILVDKLSYDMFGNWTLGNPQR